MISVFIVDDHPVVQEGIKYLLSYESDIEVCGCAINAQSCIAYFEKHDADVVLMDIGLPDKSGIDLCREIKQSHPQVMIIGLSSYSQGNYVTRMLENGASGYVLKNADKSEMIEAIHAASRGRTYLCFEASLALRREHTNRSSVKPMVTRREREILELISEGYTNPEIAAQLFLSPATIDTHRKNLLAKLNVKNTANLVKFAMEHHLIGSAAG